MDEPMPPLSWLHLGDLQIGTSLDEFYKLLIFDIQQTLQRASISPLNFTAITGDISAAGQYPEFKTAAEFLRQLLSGLSFGDQPIFFIPGNHDFDLRAGPPTKAPDFPAKLEDLYSTYLKNYLGISQVGYEPINRAHFAPDSLVYAQRLEQQGRPVAVVGLNSAFIDGLDPEKVDAFKSVMAGQLDALVSEIPETDLRILLVHHPLRYLPAEMSQFIRNAFDFVLTSHLDADEPPLAEMQTDTRAIEIRCGSSLHGPHPNTYNLVRLDMKDGLQGKIYFRRYDDERKAWVDDHRGERSDGTQTFQREFPFSLGEPEGGDDTIGEPGPGEQVELREYLAGYISDSFDEKSQDQLDIMDDVRAFSAVLAYKELVPPLCLGIFGDWGAGKSFFMKKMKRRIEHLAAREREDIGSTDYCAHIAQIEFNAWHYVDADLWASLVNHIFDELNVFFTEQRSEDLERARQEAEKARVEMEEAREAWKTQQANIEQLQRGLSSPGEWLRTALLTSRSLLKSLGVSLVIWGVIVAAILVSGWLVELLTSWAPLQRALGSLSGLTKTIAALSSQVVAAVGSASAILKKLNERLVEETTKREQQAKQEYETKRGEYEKVQQDLDELQLAPTELKNLDDYIRDIVASQDYKGRLGVISKVNEHFEGLSRRLSGDASGEGVRVERIILYIDDLDRCPEESVRDVLQAVHLMLAFRLFVVVVGVDPRWLLRSLEQVYPALRADLSPRAGWSEEELWAWQSTPQNYLEKIFQIPYNLRSMDKTGLGNLVTTILPVQQEPTAAPPDRDEQATQGKAPPETPPAPQTPGDQATPAGQPTGEPEPPSGELGQSVDSGDVGGPTPSTPAEVGTEHEQPEEKIEIDPRPEVLRVTSAERAFISELAEFIPTPRAAKRFVNIYRIMRATVPPDQLPAFIGAHVQAEQQRESKYRAAMVLLALLTGFPRQAPFVFRHILGQNPDWLWSSLVDSLRPRLIPGDPAQRFRNSAVPIMSRTESLDWTRLHSAMSQLVERELVPEHIGPYQDLIPRVAHFSFRTGKVTQVVLAHPDVNIASIDARPESEHVIITNQGGASQALGNWKLRDRAGHTFTFPQISLPAGGQITVWTAEGQDTSTDLHWGRRASVWNIDGDVAELLDENDNTVDTFAITA